MDAVCCQYKKLANLILKLADTVLNIESIYMQARLSFLRKLISSETASVNKLSLNKNIRLISNQEK